MRLLYFLFRTTTHFFMSKRSIEGVEGAEGVSAAAPVAKKSKAAPLTKEDAIRALENMLWEQTNEILEFMLRLPEELSADFDVWIIALKVSTIPDVDVFDEWEEMRDDPHLQELYGSIPRHLFGLEYENTFTVAAIHATDGFCVFAHSECRYAAFTNKQCFITWMHGWGCNLVEEAWSMAWFKGDHLDEFNIRSDPDVLRSMIQLLEDNRNYRSDVIFDIMLPSCFDAKTLVKVLNMSNKTNEEIAKVLKEKFAWFYHDFKFVRSLRDHYNFPLSTEDCEELKAFAELFPRHMQERLMRY